MVTGAMDEKLAKSLARARTGEWESLSPNSTTKSASNSKSSASRGLGIGCLEFLGRGRYRLL